jgi:hypothetical protein
VVVVDAGWISLARFWKWFGLVWDGWEWLETVTPLMGGELGEQVGNKSNQGGLGGLGGFQDCCQVDLYGVLFGIWGGD